MSKWRNDAPAFDSSPSGIKTFSFSVDRGAMLTPPPRRPQGWRLFDGLLELFTVVFVCFLGGAANRIRGGFLTIPTFETSNNGAFGDIMLRDLPLRLVWCLAIGLLVGLAINEPAARARRSRHARRFGIAVFMAFATWASILVGWGVYFGLGRGDTSQSRIGVFDWLIGHECKDWGFARRWVYSYAGMSLRGLLQTVPAGLGLFAFGYGPDYMLSGITMGLVYEISADIPSTVPNLETGPAIAELMWGCWTFFILQSVILAHRSDPSVTVDKLVHRPASGVSWWRRLLFYLPLVFVLALFVGSCIGYGFVKQADQTNFGQSWLGLFASTGVLLAVLLGVVGRSALHADRGSTGSLMPSSYDYLEIQDPPSVDESPVCVPGGARPWRYFLAFIRLLSVLDCLLVFVLVWIAMFANRVVPATSCTIEWNST